MNKGGVQEDHVVPNIIAGIYFHDCPSEHTCELDQFFTRICECKCVLMCVILHSLVFLIHPLHFMLDFN